MRSTISIEDFHLERTVKLNLIKTANIFIQPIDRTSIIQMSFNYFCTFLHHSQGLTDAVLSKKSGYLSVFHSFIGSRFKTISNPKTFDFRIRFSHSKVKAVILMHSFLAIKKVSDKWNPVIYIMSANTQPRSQCHLSVKLKL